jgi:ABC-type multidrug transport system ATPase subunit
LNQPSSGQVTILGTQRFHDVCHDVGYMAHPSLLYDEMTGMENLAYFSQLYGFSETSRCADVIRSVGLDPTLKRPVGQYSQGMRQRMSLARALLNNPKILLLDEPFSNVDLRSAAEMVILLATLRDQGKAIFVVTHQASLLQNAADEFIWMDSGRIIGRTRELKSPETAS